MGILGFSSVVGWLTVSPVVILSFSTSALLFTVGGFFYSRMNNLKEGS
jgi:hypothetical protein